jgi:hypothetical protein
MEPIGILSIPGCINKRLTAYDFTSALPNANHKKREKILPATNPYPALSKDR